MAYAPPKKLLKIRVADRKDKANDKSLDEPDLEDRVCGFQREKKATLNAGARYE